MSDAQKGPSANFFLAIDWLRRGILNTEADSLSVFDSQCSAAIEALTDYARFRPLIEAAMGDVDEKDADPKVVFSAPSPWGQKVIQAALKYRAEKREEKE